MNPEIAEYLKLLEEKVERLIVAFRQEQEEKDKLKEQLRRQKEREEKLRAKLVSLLDNLEKFF